MDIRVIENSISLMTDKQVRLWEKRNSVPGDYKKIRERVIKSLCQLEGDLIDGLVDELSGSKDLFRAFEEYIVKFVESCKTLTKQYRIKLKNKASNSERFEAWLYIKLLNSFRKSIQDFSEKL